MVAGKLLVSVIRPGEGTLNILLLGKGNDRRLSCADRCAEARVTSGRKKDTARRRRWSLRENGLTVFPPNHHSDTRTERPTYLTERQPPAEELPVRMEGFRHCHLEVADENSLGLGRPRSFPYRRRFGMFYGSIVTHIGALHPEDNVLCDVGGMVGNAFQIARNEQGVQSLANDFRPL